MILFHVLSTKGASKRAFFFTRGNQGEQCLFCFFKDKGEISFYIKWVIDQRKTRPTSLLLSVCIIFLEDTMFAGRLQILAQNIFRGGLAYFILKDLNGDPLVLFLLTFQWKSDSFRAWTQQQALSGWPITASCSFLFPLPLFLGVLLFFFFSPSVCSQSVCEGECRCGPV